MKKVRAFSDLVVESNFFNYIHPFLPFNFPGGKGIFLLVVNCYYADFVRNGGFHMSNNVIASPAQRGVAIFFNRLPRLRLRRILAMTMF